MRTSTLTRGGALLTAAVLALSLGAGPATADSSQTEKAATIKSPTGATSAPSLLVRSLRTNRRRHGAGFRGPRQHPPLRPEARHPLHAGNVPATRAAWRSTTSARASIGSARASTSAARTRAFSTSRPTASTCRRPSSPARPASARATSTTASTPDERLDPEQRLLHPSLHPVDQHLRPPGHPRRLAHHVQGAELEDLQPATGKYVAMNTMKLQYRKDGHWDTWTRSR